MAGAESQTSKGRFNTARERRERERLAFLSGFETCRNLVGVIDCHTTTAAASNTQMDLSCSSSQGFLFFDSVNENKGQKNGGGTYRFI